LNDDKPSVRTGWYGDLVRYVQLVIAHRAGGEIAVDSDFGPRTESRVKDLQAFVKLAPTGVVDWNGTWQIVDHLAGHSRSPAPTDAALVGTVSIGRYWVQRGDSPWAVAERVYGSGTRSTLLDPTEPVQPGFGAPDHPIALPEVAGATTTVGAGDRPWSLIARLAPGANPADLLERFYQLNGGPYRVLQPGDVVFLDAPR
jgi:peptidoglycan hydrolase-like protein with peptidoglycan-binding domain